MKNSQLQLAIQTAQMLLLMTPLCSSYRPLGKAISQTRSLLDQNVVAAVTSAGKHEAVTAGARIEGAHAALQKMLKDNIQMDVLLAQHTSKKAATWRMVLKAPNASLGAVAMEGVQRQLTAMPGLETLPDDTRGPVLRSFSSAVRNFSWQLLLLQLGMPVESATKQAALLSAMHSSNMGRERLGEVLASLAEPEVKLKASRGRSRKMNVSVDGQYTVQLVLSAQTVMADPQVQALVDIPIEFMGAPDDNLEQLLQQLTRPVVVAAGADPRALAQLRLDEFLRALQERQKRYAASAAERRKQAEVKLQADAAKALKLLDPRILKALKANPGLLEKL